MRTPASLSPLNSVWNIICGTLWAWTLPMGRVTSESPKWRLTFSAYLGLWRSFSMFSVWHLWTLKKWNILTLEHFLHFQNISRSQNHLSLRHCYLFTLFLKGILTFKNNVLKSLVSETLSSLVVLVALSSDWSFPACFWALESKFFCLLIGSSMILGRGQILVLKFGPKMFWWFLVLKLQL